MPFVWSVPDTLIGENTEVELCKDGYNVMITEENKKIFVEKV